MAKLFVDVFKEQRKQNIYRILTMSDTKTVPCRGIVILKKNISRTRLSSRQNTTICILKPSDESVLQV